jgi:hypothetical protein
VKGAPIGEPPFCLKRDLVEANRKLPVQVFADDMLPARAPKVLLGPVALLLVCGPEWGQQNLFNVPSGQITEYDSLFFQQQFNFSKKSGQNNSTFDCGIGNGFEIAGSLLEVLILVDYLGWKFLSLKTSFIL